MYGNLGLIGSFSRCGAARSAWGIGRLLSEQGKDQEAAPYYREAVEGLAALGRVVDGELEEHDFNQLLNYVDS